MNKIINKIRTHSVARNSFALFVLQLANLLAPLMALPYLTRVLGVEGFGILMIAFSISTLGVIIVDYGFNLHATFLISKKREDFDYIGQLIGAILIIKCCLVFSLAVIGIFVVSVFDIPLLTKSTLLAILFNVAFLAFLPTWFFLGIERMRNVTIYMVISKLTYLVLVFVWIKSESESGQVMYLLALSNLLAVIVALYSIYKSGYKIKLPRQISILNVFIESTPFFISRASVAVYTSASTFVVGAFAGVQQAAFYGASEKIYQASQSVAGPISQALFPYMAKKQNTEILLKVIFVIGFPLLLGCALISIWAGELLGFIFGDEFSQSGNILRLFLIATVVNFVSVNFGYPAFAGLNKVYIANYTVVVGAVMQVVFLYLLYINNNISALTVLLSVLITEFIVMALRCYFYFKYKGIKC